MANHVDNTLTVTGNHAVIAQFQRIFAKIDEGVQSASFLPEWDGDDFPSHDWMYENIGAKWAFVSDAEDEYANITSAWSSIFPFVQKLGYHLESLDPKVRLELTYVDECHNFAGAAVFSKNGWDVEEEDHTFFENLWIEQGGIDFEHEDFDTFEYRDLIFETIYGWVKEL
jgi:hypothetical protein